MIEHRNKTVLSYREPCILSWDFQNVVYSHNEKDPELLDSKF